MSELVDEAEALQANVEAMKRLSDSLATFNEFFASWLYVMQMNALTTDWPQAPTNASFDLAKKRAASHDRDTDEFRAIKRQPARACRIQLEPVYPRQCTALELEEHLALLSRPSSKFPEFLYLPKRTTWASGNVALVFGPRHVFKAGEWTEETGVLAYQGRILEFFYAKTGTVCYAGTYRCHHTRRWFPHGVQMPSGISAKAIADTAMPEPEFRRPATVPQEQSHRDGEAEPGELRLAENPWQSSVWKMYLAGILRVDCMVLECVGFNRALYDRMRGWCSPELPSKRAAEGQAEGEAGPPNKRLREHRAG
ncbi:putative DASH complex subunit Dam1 [Lyophyllum shimeji]|uniref:DASH complex subunit DAM1 n=1 Tax=Lyophyllum shimeji TaxID=47721 RepID=A0A9P3UKE3_LYOSH|nr:putative DASH complex subunit Dam1 [Lyophyllum shimeji]